MGGNALKCGSIRINKEFYNRACVALEEDDDQSLLKHYLDARVIPSYRNKDDFGDIDVLCLKSDLRSGSSDISFMWTLEKSFGMTELVRNGNVLSFDMRRLGSGGNAEVVERDSAVQVDLMEFSDLQTFWFAYYYFSYNDLGNLLGRIAHNMGFKLGHDGLTYKFTRGTYLHREITLTTGWFQALEFLGYDIDRYMDGFDDLEDIFEFVASGPYFHPEIFLLENRDGESRRRDRKRKTYNAFLKWCEDNKERLTRYEYSTDKTPYLIKAFGEYPTFKSEYHKCVHEVYVKEQIKRLFNGSIIKDLTGFQGKMLGAFMNHVENSFGSKALFEQKLLWEPEEVMARVTLLEDDFRYSWKG